VTAMMGDCATPLCLFLCFSLLLSLLLNGVACVIEGEMRPSTPARPMIGRIHAMLGETRSQR